MTAYDSDQESIDLDESPRLSLENSNKSASCFELCLGDLLDAECAQEQREGKLEEIEKELQIFSLDDCKPSETNVPDMEIEDKLPALQPPAKPFFTSKPCRLYSADTLIWPEARKNEDIINAPNVRAIHTKIKQGFSQRHFLSRKKEVFLYHFHLMISTNDYALMHCAFRTLIHLMDTASLNFNIFSDILLGLANLGADISQFGQDPSALSSPVVGRLEADARKPEKQHGTFKENKIALLKFLSEHLERTKEYSTAELNLLFRIVFAIGFDPLILDSGNNIHIQNICHHLLSLYPSTEVFINEALRELVKYTMSYCNFHHMMAYLISNYIMPIHKRGQILRSTMAFLEAEVILQRNDQDLRLDINICAGLGISSSMDGNYGQNSNGNLMDIVGHLTFPCNSWLNGEWSRLGGRVLCGAAQPSLQYSLMVKDILLLIEERLDVLHKEQDSYLLRSLFTLLDACISDEPLPADQRAKLQKLCDIVEPIMKKRRTKCDDQVAQHLGHLIGQLLLKWRLKAGCTKRQQTLYELKGNFTPSLSAMG